MAGIVFGGQVNSIPLTLLTGEIMAGEYLSHSFSSRTSINERFELFPNLSNPGQYRFTFESHVVTKLNKWLGWQLSIADLYVSNPPVGVKQNDLILSTGLRLTFGGVAQ